MRKEDQLKEFEKMFRKFQPRLVHYAFLQLRSKEDAREVVQDVFVRIWDKGDVLEFGEGLQAYLYKSVRNHCLNLLKRNRLESLEDNERYLSMPAEDNLEDEQDRTRLRIVKEAISELPANCQEIFIMSRMEGLSHKEIAEVLEISPKTVENQVGIALKKIRTHIANYSGHEI